MIRALFLSEGLLFSTTQTINTRMIILVAALVVFAYIIMTAFVAIVHEKQRVQGTQL